MVKYPRYDSVKERVKAVMGGRHSLNTKKFIHPFLMLLLLFTGEKYFPYQAGPGREYQKFLQYVQTMEMKVYENTGI